jgi:hypothetical protein
MTLTFLEQDPSLVERYQNWYIYVNVTFKWFRITEPIYPQFLTYLPRHANLYCCEAPLINSNFF